MYVKRIIPLKYVLPFGWRTHAFMLLWSSLIVLLYQRGWVKHVGIPFLPVGIIGTAVAFYVGFKNNSSYDRLWEARRIWGGIVNMSRNWTAGVIGFVTAEHARGTVSPDELEQVHRELVFRHLAWLNALRHALLQRRSWEHDYAYDRRERVLIEADTKAPPLEFELDRFVGEQGRREAMAFRNPPLQLLTVQTERLRDLKQQGLIEDFRHMELQKIITELVNEQGRAERIKNFPFPRQYGIFSTVFIAIFILLVPLGLVFEFGRVQPGMTWLAVPVSVLICWVFVTMEMIGDYSENPFEGLTNDIPMFSMCRTIEADLRQMIGDTDLPEPVKPVDGILM
jgi:ion channel-forming bestrophin family protein